MKILNKLKKDDLLRSGSLMFFAVLFTGGVNWLYQVIMGRALGTELYGEFGALFAIAFFITFILTRTIRVYITGTISRMKSQKRLNLIPDFHFKVFTKFTIIGVVACIIFALASPLVADFLHIESFVLVMIIGFIFIFSWPLPVNLGTLQGLQRFKSLATNNFLQATSKLVFSVILVIVLGFGIYGAVGGLIFGPIAGIIISFYLLRNIVNFSWFGLRSNPQSSTGSNSTSKSKTEKVDYKTINDQSFQVTIAVACLMIPTNIDIILVKHFFTSADAGLFTAASVFGKLIYFLPVGISTVMYPKVIEAHIKKKNTQSLLNRSLIYTGLPASLMVILYLLFPRFFLQFYGDKFLEADSLLIVYGPLMFIFSLIALFIYYNLAKNQFGLIYIFACISIIEVVLIWTLHTTLISILTLMLIMNTIILVCCIIITYYYELRKE